ncbi:MAG TPA: hypothetical protein VF310_05120 [Vicinamibacteria bacterium]
MRRPTRRRFLKSLAVAPLLPAAAQAPPLPTPPPAAEAAPSPSPTPTPTPEATPLALALAEAVRHRFGDALSAEDLAQVAKSIDGNLRSAARLRERVRQGNADEPVTRFEARPAPAPPPPAPPAPRAPRARRRRPRR